MCRGYRVSLGKKKNTAFLKLGMKHSQNLGKFSSIYDVGIWVQCLSSFPSLCKAHCVLLILSSVQIPAGKKKKKNVNRKINAKYNFFWGVYWFPLSLPYFSSNLVCMPILCVSLQISLEFWQKSGKKGKEKKDNYRTE